MTMIRTLLISLVLLSASFPLTAQIRKEMEQYYHFTMRGPVLRVIETECGAGSFGQSGYIEHPTPFITCNSHRDIDGWGYEPGSPLKQCSYTYDSLDRLSAATIFWRGGGLMAVFQPFGLPMIEEHERYAYDAEGKLRTVERWTGKEDILIRRIDYAYDSLGRLAETVRRDYAKYTHEIRRVEQLEILEEPAATRTLYAYDSAGRIRTATKIGNTDEDLLIGQHWSYSSDGGSRMSEWGFYEGYFFETRTTTSDAHGWVVADSMHSLFHFGANSIPFISHNRYVLDSLGNPILSIHTSEDGITDTTRYNYLYDAYGNWTTTYYYSRRRSSYHDRHPVGPYELHVITERKIEYFPEDSVGQ